MRVCLPGLALVLALVLASCAAHNSHRIPIDMNADLAPLIDEAWSRMEEAAGAPVPVGGVPVSVAVERVDVQWLPFSPEVPPGGEVITQPELIGYIQEALRAKVTPEDEYAERCVRVGLAVDLHEPDALEIQVECELLDASKHVLAHGFSIIVRFPRLYCHGCRDRWSGHGATLDTGAHGTPGEGYVDGGAGFLFYFPSSSPGYHKN